MADEFDPFDDIEKFRSPEAEAGLKVLRDDMEARKRDGINIPPGVSAKLTAHRAKCQKPAQRPDDRFIQIPVRALVAASKVLHSKQWLVLLAIHDRIGKDDSNTIELGNKTLKEWGVDHMTKVRTLRLLEQSEDYQVQWRGKRSPRITVSEELTILPGRRRRRGG
jgi:hypothetical protein